MSEEIQDVQPQQEAPIINISLDLNEVNYLIGLLSEKPIKEAILVWDKIRVQTIQQIQPAPAQ